MFTDCPLDAFVLLSTEHCDFHSACILSLQDYTRVWLLCEVRVSRLLPQWITDYAARRAMPRATTWLKPQVEAANVLWLNKKGRNAR